MDTRRDIAPVGWRDTRRAWQARPRLFFSDGYFWLNRDLEPTVNKNGYFGANCVRSN
jgi:hypothetical protein